MIKQNEKLNKSKWNAIIKNLPGVSILQTWEWGEVVRRLQTMRRSAGFDIADHIITYYQGDDYMKQVMEDFADYIKQETLSQQFIDGVPGEGVFTLRYKLSGYDILLGVKRLT